MKTTILIAALWISPSLLAGPIVSLTQLTSAVAGGPDFTVSLQVTNVFTAPYNGIDEALLAFGFNISTTGAINIVSFTPGSLFTDQASSAQASAVATNIFINPADVSGALTLGTLRFSAASAGAASITVSSSVNILDTGLFYLSATDPLNATTSLSVAGASAVPEPSTLGLAALAAGWLCLKRRPLEGDAHSGWLPARR